MDWRSHIITDENILLGTPIFKGTQTAVVTILQELENDSSHEKVLEAHPEIKIGDLLAMYAFLKDFIEQQFLFPFTRPS